MGLNELQSFIRDEKYPKAGFQPPTSPKNTIKTAMYLPTSQCRFPITLGVRYSRRAGCDDLHPPRLGTHRKDRPKEQRAATLQPQYHGDGPAVEVVGVGPPIEGV